MTRLASISVIPAKAGIQLLSMISKKGRKLDPIEQARQAPGVAAQCGALRACQFRGGDVEW